MHSVVIVNTNQCTGCRSCEVACSLFNLGECNPERARIRVIRFEDDGPLEFIPATCMQCETAMCELVCPRSAISRDPQTGARLVSETKCIGCSACSYACPFGACFVDRRLGRSIICSQCNGDPTCVKVCATGALSYVAVDRVGTRLKREFAQRTIEALAQRQVAARPVGQPAPRGPC